jgi:hypothetical protein
VTIGNPGNADDTGVSGDVYGGVPYLYQMGVTEVAQNWITKATESGMDNVDCGRVGWATSRRPTCLGTRRRSL